jgi:hypothetical protein
VAASSFTIAPLTVPAGRQVFGPFGVPGGWSAIDLTLDLANIVAPLNVLAEYSVDGGVTWLHLFSEDNVSFGINLLTGLPETTTHHHADWGVNDGNDNRVPISGPAMQVRLTLTNPVAFLSSGGSLVVS